MRFRRPKELLGKVNVKIALLMLGRLSIISVISLVMATINNYGNHKNYWERTIFATQTVDFNILSHTLPTKLSLALLEGETEELQRTLDSNYGLFGLVVTNCESAIADCPEQEILYYSNSRRLGKEGFKVENLTNEPYDLLRDPPPLFAERKYKRRYQPEADPTGMVNRGEIIGRVYYVRRVPPTFAESYAKWARGLLRFQHSPSIFSLTAGIFLAGGAVVWLLIEFVLYRKRRERKQLLEEARNIREELQQKVKQNEALIAVREKGRKELEDYRREQQSIAAELKIAIADYEQKIVDFQHQQDDSQSNLQELRNQLAWAVEYQVEAQEEIDRRSEAIANLENCLNSQNREQQEMTRTLEKWQRQLQETEDREKRTNEQIVSLNQKIAELTREYDQAIQQSADLQSQLREQADVEQLRRALESAREESECIKEQSRDFEVYITEENESLAAKIRQLENELGEHRSRILYLKSRLEDREVGDHHVSDSIEPEDCFTPANLSRSTIPSLSSSEVIRGLHRLEFVTDHQTGSHVHLKKTLVCRVPHHAKDVPYGILKNILQSAKITEQELRDNF
ncbi:type II toxin-antitoxin system HicA family toxin [Arthrospira platensis]|uniref:type II toxin-antitoxin system HicA family toxin n=1 Tax=Limnospira TaxID=2596745 RepID=UPI0016888AA1|nr:type II toxin-antitoxin system HicA family toxin [Arthrospira platensis]MBD2574634.1 type II toxin-antitoxin system HicA family toxin [Arthrospira platensis FACHB-971]MBD2711650.1 type II toxin-antitoxin system HicA family toxin [Arthrospira platensis FACHB-835]MDT9184114.1 type II toxin-antitoxin system HicA family toxin [Limnospira sp. PMC 289.06]QQW31422.1 type II toxin-antitoxin system HicA family toxin [Arthrospira sp. PCC 9108]